jgi:hypothetical protein
MRQVEGDLGAFAAVFLCLRREVMSVDRLNAVHIGYGKDALGFRCEVLEDPDSGARMVAYSPEDWWNRNRHIETLKSLNKRVPETKPEYVPLDVKR